MSDDLRHRLRDLPPDLQVPGDRWEAVRARVARRRRRVVAAGVAGGVALVAGGLPVTLALVSGGGPRPGAAAAPSCPATVDSGAMGPRVPAPPGGLDLSGRLVPVEPPDSAVLCAYRATDDAQATPALSGDVRIAPQGLSALAADLSYLPRRLPEQSHGCTAIGNLAPVTYLLGLGYPDGILWVATQTDANRCVDTTNGSFSSPVYIGDQVQAAYEAGGWVAPPQAPPVRTSDPCAAGRPGRLGQESVLIPGTPTSALVCEGTRPDQSVATDFRYRSVTVTDAVGGLAAALNALPTRPSRGSCSMTGPAAVEYSVQFRYAAGPPVTVHIAPYCTPAVDNRSLESADGSTVIALLQPLLAGR
jgi:hypothetical protein